MAFPNSSPRFGAQQLQRFSVDDDYDADGVKSLARINSMSNLWHNVIARVSGRPRSVVTPICFINKSHADIPWPMRTDLGGHDPATPFAELIINTHSMFWAPALFIIISAAYMIKK